jgi:hypothetical protein
MSGVLWVVQLAIAGGFAASGEGLEVIRSLPIFTTVSGEFTDIASGDFVTCPPGVAFADTLSHFSGRAHPFFVSIPMLD